MKPPVRSGAKECLDLTRVKAVANDFKREICIDPDTQDLLSDESRRDGETNRREFADYQPFGELRYPRSLKHIKNGDEFERVVVTLLEQKSYGRETFTPPANAVVRRQCEGMTYPVALKTPDPDYPASARQNHVTGTSIVELTVLPDGSVNDVHLVGSSVEALDAETQKMISKWKFKPAMCGTEPITYDINVEVNFRLAR